ncbi:DUF6573 family protein [Streptomyces sp. 8K308]|uniref:DUF6573 family protein n=1 Tax=Streptomyces sp. 8K308 TaxID=2530388 RepID=UPI001A9EBE43|nr:DUF6573 family protein [Streptomyces sp. 8K308]
MNSKSTTGTGRVGRDWEVSADAMRWTPQSPATPQAARGADCDREVVHGYSRADALADGVLVAIDGELARQAGLWLPVALTTAAYGDCVAWSEEDNKRKGTCQDEAGRLWDVLHMVRFAVLRARSGGGRRCLVELYRVPRAGRSRVARRTVLAMEIGPGDSGEPVLTVMLPDED